ncbi:MAG: cytochrome c [Betaproteobacteria bacterium]|nr:cytochrome c [Betaproteobacteria bacterium]
MKRHPPRGSISTRAPRRRFLQGLAAGGAVSVVLALAGCGNSGAAGDDPRADPRDASRVAAGAGLYAQHCASCHGVRREGQPDWRQRLPNGRLPAPPHDESGHSWHHPDAVLFAITKYGFVPPYAPPGYASDMPAFGGRLSDAEIWAVLAWIKSHWTSGEVLAARREMTRNAR